MQSVVVPWSNQNVAASNTMNKLQVKLPEIRTKMSCMINYAHHQVHLTMINMIVTSVVLVAVSYTHLTLPTNREV